MTALRTFFTITPAERRLVWAAAPLVLVIRLALWLLPTRVILRQAKALALQASDDPGQQTTDVQAIVWAIEAVSRRVPHATCLTQALAAQYLLAKHGYGSSLCFGVARGEHDLHAHAWLERGERVLIGATEQEFERLSELRRSI